MAESRTGLRARVKVPPPPLHLLHRPNATTGTANQQPPADLLGRQTGSPPVAPVRPAHGIPPSDVEQQIVDMEWEQYEHTGAGIGASNLSQSDEVSSEEADDWDAHERWLVQQRQKQKLDEQNVRTPADQDMDEDMLDEESARDGGLVSNSGIARADATTEQTEHSSGGGGRGLNILRGAMSIPAPKKSGWGATKSLVPLFRFSTVVDENDTRTGDHPPDSESRSRLLADDEDEAREGDAQLKAVIFRQVGEYLTEFKDGILTEVAQSNDEGETMDGVFDTLSSTSSLLLASPVPSQSTLMMHMVLAALIFTEFMQALMTYKLWKNAKAPDVNKQREFILEGFVDLLPGFGRQNYSTFEAAIAEIAALENHNGYGYWGIVPDYDGYNGCKLTPDNTNWFEFDLSPQTIPELQAERDYMRQCRKDMADDYTMIFDHQLSDVIISGEDVTYGSLPQCQTPQGLKNGSVNLFVGIFLVLFTVMKEVFEVLTTSFTITVSGGCKEFSTYLWVFWQLVFHVGMVFFLVYASVRQMVTVANDIWAVIEASISVFLVTQIDDWVQYCLMRHPHMQMFRKLLRSNANPSEPTKIMTRQMVIGKTADTGVLSDEVNRTIIIRGVGGRVPTKAIFGADTTHASETIEMSNQDVLFKVFSRFGEFCNATVRKRVVKVWEKERLERLGVLYEEVEGGLDTSWALITMGSIEAANKACAVSPMQIHSGVEKADGTIGPAKVLTVTPYSQVKALLGKGAMKSVLLKHEWIDTGATVLVPMQWIRATADVHGFAVWHHFIEIFFVHAMCMFMGGRLAKFGETSCTTLAKQRVLLSTNGFALLGTSSGNQAAWQALSLVLLLIAITSSPATHLTTHAKYTVEVFSPKPHLVPWLMGDPWKIEAGSSTENEDLLNGTLLDPMWVLEWGFCMMAIAIVVLIIPNEALWTSLETVRDDVFPRSVNLYTEQHNNSLLQHNVRFSMKSASKQIMMAKRFGSPVALATQRACDRFADEHANLARLDEVLATTQRVESPLVRGQLPPSPV